MAKKHGETFFIVDHANKQADRDRTNPNRRKLRLLRAWNSVPEDSTDVVRETSRKRQRESQ